MSAAQQTFFALSFYARHPATGPGYSSVRVFDELLIFDPVTGHKSGHPICYNIELNLKDLYNLYMAIAFKLKDYYFIINIFSTRGFIFSYIIPIWK